MNRRIEVSAGLVFRDGRLLITQRYPDAHLANLWEFPGGKREHDETFEACLVRELREELGIETATVDLFDEIQHDYPEKSVWLKFFRCRLLSGEPKPIGCQAVAWVERETIEQFPFPAADAQLLERLKHEPEAWL